MTTARDEHILDSVYSTLWLTYGLVPIAAGADKFVNFLTDWAGYVSPLAASMLPVSPQAFMYVVGVVEIAVGVMILTRSTTRIGAYVASVWLALIAVNLLTMGAFDIAVRDIVMAVGAWCLGRLAELRATSEVGASAPLTGRPAPHAPAGR